MKVTILKQDLSKVLTTALRFVSTRSQLPILGNIVIKTSGNSLIIMSTNLESSIVSKLGAKVEEEGEIAVPARTIVDIITNLNIGPVSLETEKDQLKIKTDSFEGKVMAINTSDFPKLPSKITKGINLDARELSMALSKVVFAVSADETRPILTGVLFLFKGNTLTLVSSDGFRLSLFKIKTKETLDEVKLVVPRVAVMELIKLASEIDSIGIEIKESENQVIFQAGDTVFSTRTLEGTFPDYEKIIPRESPLKISVGKDEFAQAIKLASIFAREGSNIAKVIVEKEKLIIDAESTKSGKQKSQIEAKVEGLTEKFEIIFNYRFLEEFINSVDGEVIDISFNESTSPGVFGDPRHTQFLHIVMPVKIQG